MSFFEIINRKHEPIHPLGVELNLKLNLPEEAWVSLWQEQRLLLLTTSRDACVGRTDNSCFELHVAIPFLLKERANIKVSSSEGR